MVSPPHTDSPRRGVSPEHPAALPTARRAPCGTRPSLGASSPPRGRPPVPFGDPRPPPQLRLDGPFSGLMTAIRSRFGRRGPADSWVLGITVSPKGAGCHPSPPGAGGLTSAPVARGPRRTSRLARRVPSRPSTGAARQAGRESALPGPGFGGLTGTAAGTPARGERPAPGAHGARSPRSPAV